MHTNAKNIKHHNYHDSNDSTKMVSVVTNHSNFSIQTVREHSKNYMSLYDLHDKANDKAATECLIASLEVKLSTSVKKKSHNTDTFTVMWMLLLQSVQSSSFKVYDNLKERIKGCKVMQYPGQDFSFLANDFCNNAKILTVAEIYYHSLMLNMLKTFCNLGGDGCLGEIFHFAIQMWIKMMNDALMHVQFFENDEKDSYTSIQGFTYHDICEQVEDHYHNYKDRNKWLPAKNVPDSRAPPPKFGTNVAEEKPLTHTKIMTLMQSGFAKQDKPCFECRQIGHWKHDCPKLKNGNQNGQQGQKLQQHGCRSNSQVNGQQTKSWKLTCLPGWSWTA